MPKKDMKETKQKIMNTLKEKGPSLPVHIARSIGIEMIFASAFLSELVSDKKVRVSNMKVGGSPVYYLSGQKDQLEKYFKYLNNREKEAFELLKEKKVLADENQKPPVRVALRSLDDFANHFTINTSQGQKIYWRFHNIDEGRAREIIKERSKDITKNNNQQKSETKEVEKQTQQKQEEAEEERNQEEEKQESKKEEQREKEQEEKVKKEQEKQEREIEKKQEKKEKPLLELDQEKDQTGKKKCDFVNNKVLDFFNQQGIEGVKEKEDKKNRYIATVNIKSNIGKLRFLSIVRDKKNVSKSDIMGIMDRVRNMKMPALLITSGELRNNAKEYIDQHPGWIKLKKL